MRNILINERLGQLFPYNSLKNNCFPLHFVKKLPTLFGLLFLLAQLPSDLLSMDRKLLEGLNKMGSANGDESKADLGTVNKHGLKIRQQSLEAMTPHTFPNLNFFWLKKLVIF
ncbi:MAG: hypothetical protein LBT70_01930 [Holosporaceae bacterium]|jgi:hypothetical protein|nr:hypothetical protein [Holosporaceae bacterium]